MFTRRLAVPSRRRTVPRRVKINLFPRLRELLQYCIYNISYKIQYKQRKGGRRKKRSAHLLSTMIFSVK